MNIDKEIFTEHYRKLLMNKLFLPSKIELFVQADVLVLAVFKKIIEGSELKISLIIEKLTKERGFTEKIVASVISKEFTRVNIGPEEAISDFVKIVNNLQK